MPKCGVYFALFCFKKSNIIPMEYWHNFFKAYGTDLQKRIALELSYSNIDKDLTAIELF